MDPRRRVSQMQERSLAERFGATLHAGSGSGARKHDMHTDDSLIECKTVLKGNRQITIKEDDWKSLRYHAAVQDRNPVLHIELGKYRLVLIPEEDHAESLE